MCGCECWFLHFSPCRFICVGDMPWSLSPECIQRVLSKERWGRGISGCDLSQKCRQPSLFRPIQVRQGDIRSRPPCFWLQYSYGVMVKDVQRMTSYALTTYFIHKMMMSCHLQLFVTCNLSSQKKMGVKLSIDHQQIIKSMTHVYYYYYYYYFLPCHHDYF